MLRQFVAGMVALGCASAVQAQVKSCPPGQILRVSSGVCQPKSTDTLRQLTKGKPGVVATRPAEALADGRNPVAGVPPLQPTGPSRLSPAPAPALVPEAATRTGRAGAAAKDGAARALAGPGRLGAAEAPRPAPAASVGRARAPLAAEPRASLGPAARGGEAVERSPGAASSNTPAPSGAAVASPPAAVAAPATDQVAAIPRAPRALSLDKPTFATHPFGLLGEGAGAELFVAARAAPNRASPGEAQSVASTQVVATPVRAPVLPPPPEASREPTGGDGSLPEWGDRQVFADALRAGWKGGAVTLTFRRGTQLATDIPLQPIPEPFASRNSTGVQMHYVVANDDIVLVLPLLRVVVDVYPARASARADG